VSYGIHAYLNREDYGYFQVRAYIYPEDIIGVNSGESQIAAKRIFFHPEDVGV